VPLAEVPAGEQLVEGAGHGRMLARPGGWPANRSWPHGQ
jgi:hypothetical protein